MRGQDETASESIGRCGSLATVPVAVARFLTVSDRWYMSHYFLSCSGAPFRRGHLLFYWGLGGPMSVWARSVVHPCLQVEFRLAFAGGRSRLRWHDEAATAGRQADE